MNPYTLQLVGPKATADESIAALKAAIDEADAIVVGAGAGLSTAAGFTYTGERFDRYFSDFAEKYGFADMYSGGFTAFESPEEQWAFWSRYIWINRYTKAPKDTYAKLLALLEGAGKPFFVITTNVDHQFQASGFPKEQLYYTQGDYGLWQCSKPCHAKTYDNEDVVRRMVDSQGWIIGEDGALSKPAWLTPKMEVPAALVPTCPVCGRPMSMNLRADNTFVEDEGWHAANVRYQEFLDEHEKGRVLYLELGVGFNTPVIIKYPFWRRTLANRHATYACINYNEAYTLREITGRSILIGGDIDEALEKLAKA